MSIGDRAKRYIAINGDAMQEMTRQEGLLALADGQATCLLEVGYRCPNGCYEVVVKRLELKEVLL